MATTWTATYEKNEIRIENSWFLGEKLFVNNKLQDEKNSFFFPAVLTGHLVSNDGEKKPIKINLSGWFTIGCRLFVDDEKVEVIKVSYF
jgi:hypothetical protein